MNKVKLLERAMFIAYQAHVGQYDKGGYPYIFHPIRVSLNCNKLDEKIVALLHDVIEDSNVTPTQLKAEGFPDYIIEAVLSVTRKQDESYEDFINRASKNKIGKIVKIKDLEDNMDITRLNKNLTEPDISRIKKYVKFYNILTHD